MVAATLTVAILLAIWAVLGLYNNSKK